ncbi:MAG: hypothetical protein H6672_03525 [Anaerolineaceae bacterium]|nr:hypothetical protein [Anaerolineaceae bacterium]
MRTEPNALGHLARKLADFNILVLTGDTLPTFQYIADDTPRHLEAWVNTYGEIYKAFVGALFPHHNPNITGHHTDSQWPVIIYLRGVITPVIQAMADYVVPYIAVRQTERSIMPFELVGLLDMMLVQLEGQDIHHDVRTQLQNTCVQHLNTLLSSPIRQYPLMPGAPDLFTDSRPIQPIEIQSQRPPVSGSPAPEPPPKPPGVPGMMPQAGRTDPSEPIITTHDTGTSSPLTEPTLPRLHDTGAHRPNGDTQQLSETNPIPPGIEDQMTPSPDVPDAATVEPPQDTEDPAGPQSSDLRNFFGIGKRNTQEQSKKKSPPTWVLRPNRDDDKKE